MRNATVVTLLFLLATGTATAGEASFTAKPTAVREGDKVKITFTVAAPADIELAILDAQGRLVRHLAAGVLGRAVSSPYPLKEGLSQTLEWDLRDDLGKPAQGGPFRVRVSLGSTPRLDKHVGFDGKTIGPTIAGLVVGKDGELYVLDSEPGWGRSSMRVFDKNGQYLRTIMPWPAGTPQDRTASIGHIEVEGERLPIVFNAHGHNLLPLTSGMKTQDLCWHPKGYLVACSAVGEIAEHGPPRHLLAFAPEGGAPEGLGFVGPQIRKPVGFMGGSGERDCAFFDHLAVSPDGEWLYLAPCKVAAPQHAIYRVKWSDKELGAPFLGKEKEAGADDAHFSEPEGLATDKAGNLFVCDWGNNRVMVFSPDATLLGQFPVEKPLSLAVHAGSGEMYILSKGRDAKRADRFGSRSSLLKFSAWVKGEQPKELARLEGKDIVLFALDSSASPTRLWAALNMGWGKPHALVAISDKGESLEWGQTVSNANGLSYPMFLAADAARGRVLLREKSGGLVALDLNSGKISGLGLKGTDMALDRDGNIYVMDGYGSGSLSRYTPQCKPLPFAATGSHKLPIGTYRSYGPDMGLRGHCVAPNGDVYVIRSCNVDQGIGGNLGCVVDVFGPDGTQKKTPLITNLGYGDCGLGVDAAGNVYLGVNVKPKDKPFPDPFMGKVSAEPFVWWRKGKREPPWQYAYYNPYLFHWGSVLKFGPEGGAFYGNSLAGKDHQPALPVSEAPPLAASFLSGYLAKEVKVVGMKWRYAGCGPVPASDCNWGDPSCVCMTSHLAADEYGRVFAPNVFRFSVEMLDSSGNQVVRIGRYGNADSAGPGSKVAEPEIAFAWPAFVSVSEGKVYVSDTNNRRVTVVKLEHAAEETCEVR